METPDHERSALASAIERGIRPVGRSHRLHRPRGGFCARGYCQQCPFAGPEGRALACETPDAPGGLPGNVDPLRIAGRLGERMEPWFYERRFLRPRALRQTYLAVLRRLSAAERVPDRPPTAAGPARTIDTDVLVVGGGPAGLAAAATIAATASVTLVTRTAAGGSLPKPASVASRIAEDARRLARHGGALWERTTCLGFYEDDGLVGAITRDGPVTIHAERLVVATGAYDRPLLVPGADLPGVIGLRAFELLSAQRAFAPGTTIGVFGAAPETERALRCADALDLPIAWAATTDPAGRAGSTIEPARSLVRVDGRRRVRSVLLDGDDRRRADVLVLAFTQPTYELQLHNGMAATLSGTPPVIVAGGPGRIPMVVVGEAAGWTDTAMAQDAAADAAAAWLEGRGDARSARSDDSTTGALPADGLVCACEDVRVRDLDRAIAEGFGHVELIKRRSGAGTGACQGKLCLCLIGEVLASRGVAAAFPTVRPPIRPVAVSGLAGGP